MDFEIKKYAVSHMSNYGNTTHLIKMYDNDGMQRGIIRFLTNGASIPEPTRNTRTGFVLMYYHQEEFINIIGTLRYEKPLYCHFLDYRRNHAFISTSREEIGDQE